MRWLGNLATRLLVWIAGPFVIAGFWWRSMPAHDEGLTLAIAAALLVTLYAGLTSWWTLRARMRFPSLPAHPWHRRFRRPTGIALALLVVAVSWLRTEGGLDHYANRLVDLADAVFRTTLLEGCALRDGSGRQLSGHPHPDCLAAPDDLQERRIARAPWIPKLDWFTLTDEHRLAGIWLDEGESWTPLARTDLAGVELVDLPEAWRTPETARAAFRKTWCEREGLSMAVCDHPPSPDRPTPATREAARKAWCGQDGTDTEACLSQLADLDERFASARTEEREAARANLPRLALAGRDLRNVAAIQTSLIDADLSGARPEGADLGGARLEGADLGGARLEGAGLRYVDFRNSNWAGASNRASPAQLADFRGAQGLTQAQLEQMIGNEQTLLPDTGNLTIPSCWKTPPDGFEAMVERVWWEGRSVDEIRAEFLCPEGQEPQRTGTRLPVDAPYPDGHPLADR